MHLSRIALKNFRSYEDAEFSFDKNLTLITGRNGAGKTNLLEAIYMLLQGGSFRVTDKEMIRSGEAWWRIDGELDGEPRQLRYQLAHHPPKQILVHDTAKRFMFSDRLPVVLFEPNDLQLIHGSPSRRRDSLDVMLSSLSAPYKKTLARYDRVIQQRNNALKKQLPNLEDLLFSWDVLLSEYGVEIIKSRRDLIQKLNHTLSKYYSEIAGETQQLEIKYHTSIHDITPSQYISHLHEKLALDRLRGTTSFGPHRDDMSFVLRGEDAKVSASRGEVRTVLLALKIVYGDLLKGVYNDTPLMLLDDVFSELDEVRQRNLLGVMSGKQIIITDVSSIDGYGGNEIKI